MINDKCMTINFNLVTEREIASASESDYQKIKTQEKAKLN